MNLAEKSIFDIKCAKKFHLIPFYTNKCTETKQANYGHCPYCMAHSQIHY